MDNNNLNNNPETNNTYHATTNLNTAMENPEFVTGSATGINIEDNTNYQNNNQNLMNNTMTGETNQYDNNSFGNPTTETNQTPNFTDYSSEYQTDFYNTADNNNYYSYEPILSR